MGSDYSRDRGNFLTHSRQTDMFNLPPTSPIQAALNSSRGSLSPSYIPNYDPPKMRLSHSRPLLPYKRTMTPSPNLPPLRYSNKSPTSRPHLLKG